MYILGTRARVRVAYCGKKASQTSQRVLRAVIAFHSLREKPRAYCIESFHADYSPPDASLSRP